RTLSLSSVGQALRQRSADRGAESPVEGSATTDSTVDSERSPASHRGARLRQRTLDPNLRSSARRKKSCAAHGRAGFLSHVRRSSHSKRISHVWLSRKGGGFVGRRLRERHAAECLGKDQA